MVQPGTNYSFYSIARDNVYNIEVNPNIIHLTLPLINKTILISNEIPENNSINIERPPENIEIKVENQIEYIAQDKPVAAKKFKKELFNFYFGLRNHH